MPHPETKVPQDYEKNAAKPMEDGRKNIAVIKAPDNAWVEVVQPDLL